MLCLFSLHKAIAKCYNVPKTCVKGYIMTVREFGMLVIGMGVIGAIDVFIIYKNGWGFHEQNEKLKSYLRFKFLSGVIVALFGFCFLLAMGK